MNEDDQEELAVLMRHAALEEIDSLKLMRATMWDEHTHSFRWLMASLLALNGAACLGVLGQSNVVLPYQLAACSLFVVGILSSLLIAFFGQRAVQQTIVPLQKLIGYWMTVSLDGVRDYKEEEPLNIELASSTKTARFARLAGWAAATAFLLGTISAGIGLAKNQSSGLVSHPTSVPVKGQK